MSSGPLGDNDLPGDPGEDLQKFRELSSDGMDTSPPALLELVFGTLAAIVGIVWLASLYWVPDPIDGTTWMGLGMLGLAVTGIPAGLMFVLRRGGAQAFKQIVDGMVNG